MTTQNKLHFETLQLHVGQEQADPATDSRAVPIYQTTSYVFHSAQHASDRFHLKDAGNIYGRLTNTTQDVFEKRIAALEGGIAGLAVASGAAALTYAITALARKGDHVVAQRSIYGGTYNLLEHTLSKFGIETTFVDIHNLKEVEGAIKDNTKLVFIETLGNPNSDIPDIEAISELAHKNKIPVVIDNTFGTPYLIRPLEHGADIVVSGKFPQFTETNPSYGVPFTAAAGAAAYIVYIRAILLRDEGAAISKVQQFPRSTHSFSCRALKRFRSVLTVMWKTPRRFSNSSRSTRRSLRSTTRALQIIRSTLSTRSTSRTVQVPSSHSM